MKILIFLIIPLFAFSQVDVVSGVRDTSSLKTLNLGEGESVFLSGYSDGTTDGSGWFVVTKTSDAADGQDRFSHPTNGYKWVRTTAVDASTPVVVSDTTALKALNRAVGRYAHLKSLSSSNDFGGGEWVVMDSTYTEAYGGVVYPHPTTGKQWVRQSYLDQGLVNVIWFGAKNDLSYNSTTAFNNALKFARTTGQSVYVPGGNYSISKVELKTGDKIYGSKVVFGSHGNVTKLYPVNDLDTLMTVGYPSTGQYDITIQSIYFSGINSSDTARVGIYQQSAMNVKYIDDTFNYFYSSDTSWCVKIEGTKTPTLLKSNTILFRDCVFSYSDCGLYAKIFDDLTIEGLSRFINNNRNTPLDFGYDIYMEEGERVKIDGVNFNQSTSDSIDIIISKYTTAGQISNCYVELSSSNGNFLKLDNYDRSTLGYYNHFALINNNIKSAGTGYLIDANTTVNRSNLIIVGGRYISTNNKWIYAPSSTKNRIDIYNANFGVSGANNETIYNIRNYDSDKFSHVSKTYPVYYNYNSFSFGNSKNNGFESGIKASGASRIHQSYPYEGSGNNVISKRFEFPTETYSYLYVYGGDTIDVDISKWTSYDYEPVDCEIQVSMLMSSGLYGQIFRIDYTGAANSGSITIDTLKNDIINNMNFGTITVEAETDSSFRIVLPINSSGTRYHYFMGEIRYGNNIRNAEATKR